MTNLERLRGLLTEWDGLKAPYEGPQSVSFDMLLSQRAMVLDQLIAAVREAVRSDEPPAECPHCREVYEIWANTEGFTPVTAPEGYQQQVMTQMRDAAARGLSADQPAPPPVDNDHVAEGCEKFGEHHE